MIKFAFVSNNIYIPSNKIFRYTFLSLPSEKLGTHSIILDILEAICFRFQSSQDMSLPNPGKLNCGQMGARLLFQCIDTFHTGPEFLVFYVIVLSSTIQYVHYLHITHYMYILCVNIYTYITINIYTNKKVDVYKDIQTVQN